MLRMARPGPPREVNTIFVRFFKIYLFDHSTKLNIAGLLAAGRRVNSPRSRSRSRSKQQSLVLGFRDRCTNGSLLLEKGRQVVKTGTPRSKEACNV